MLAKLFIDAENKKCYIVIMLEKRTAKIFIFNYDDKFDYSDLLPLFSAARLQKLNACKHESMRMQYAAAEITVCEAMRAFDRPYAPPEYRYCDNGMPYIKDGYISISHTMGAAVCAISDDRVGVDIEAPRAVKPELAKKILCPEELNEFESFSEKRNDHSIAHADESLEFLPPDGCARKASNIETIIIVDRDTCLLSVWTAKESCLKLTGEGLGGGMKNFCCDRKIGCVRPLNGGGSMPVSTFRLLLSESDGAVSGNNRCIFLSVCTQTKIDLELFKVEALNGKLASKQVFYYKAGTRT